MNTASTQPAKATPLNGYGPNTYGTNVATTPQISQQGGSYGNKVSANNTPGATQTLPQAVEQPQAMAEQPVGVMGATTHTLPTVTGPTGSYTYDPNKDYAGNVAAMRAAGLNLDDYTLDGRRVNLRWNNDTGTYQPSNGTTQTGGINSLVGRTGTTGGTTGTTGNVATAPTATQQGQQGGYQLPPNVQALLQQLMGGGPGGVQTSLNTSNVPGIASGQQLTDAQKQQQDAAYKQATAYLDPQWQQQENQLRTQLVNQGIPQGSQAWTSAMDDFQRNKQFAYQQAQSNAVTQGNTAQQQLFNQGLAANQNQFGQNLAGGQFANSAQAQQAQQWLQQMGLAGQLGIAGMGAQTSYNQLQELMNQNNFNNSLTTRNQALNEMLLRQQNPLSMYQQLNAGNGVTQPNFSQAPGANIGGTDIASIIAQALGQQNNVYNAQVGAQNSQMSSYAAILAALLSDRRFKKDVVCIGMHECGVPLYTYNYLWGEPGIGVMADELERVKPEAVFTVDGVKIVDYARL